MKYKIEENIVARKMLSGQSLNPEKILHLLEGEIREVVDNYFVVERGLKIRYRRGEKGMEFCINFEVEEMKEIYFL